MNWLNWKGSNVNESRSEFEILVPLSIVAGELNSDVQHVADMLGAGAVVCNDCGIRCATADAIRKLISARDAKLAAEADERRRHKREDDPAIALRRQLAARPVARSAVGGAR